MNLNVINANVKAPATNFGCNNSNCNCSAGIVATQQPPKDTLEISKDCAEKTVSFGKKVLNAGKKAVNYLKTHKKQVAVCARAALDGILTGCTVLGANELIKKTGSTATNGIAGKLAAGSAVIVTAGKIVQNRNAFMEKQAEKK